MRDLSFSEFIKREIRYLKIFSIPVLSLLATLIIQAARPFPTQAQNDVRAYSGANRIIFIARKLGISEPTTGDMLTFQSGERYAVLGTGA